MVKDRGKDREIIAKCGYSLFLFVLGGFFGHFNNSAQKWTIQSDPDGEVAIIRRHKDGAFHLPGTSGTRFWLDREPYKYYDYNF